MKKYDALEKYIKRRYENLTGGEVVATNKRIAPNQLKKEMHDYFGVPEKDLKNVKNLGELIELTRKFPVKNSEFYKNLEKEIIEMSSLTKQQNQP